MTSKTFKPGVAVDRLVAKPTFINGSLAEPGEIVQAFPKTYPAVYPLGHEKANQPHPHAGEVTDQPFSDNLVEPTAEARRVDEDGDRPEGVPAGSVLVNGVWYAPVIRSQGEEGGEGPTDDGKTPTTLEDASKNAIAEALRKRGVTFPANATKAALIELAEKHEITITA